MYTSRSRSRALALYVGVLSVAFLCPAVLADQIVFVDAGRGPVAVHVPDAYDPVEPLPLVLGLHGYCQGGALFETSLALVPEVDARSFLYAYPTGETNPTGCSFWNATPACCDFFNSGNDDSGYLLALVNEIKASFNVDPTRVHLVGYSNGGFMSHVLACDHAGVFASLVSVAGAAFIDPSDCAASEPVHVLQIHGTADTVIFYGGGTTAGGGPYPGALASVAQWTDIAGCDPTGVPGTPFDLVSNIAGAETGVLTWTTGCAPGGSGELWTVVGGTHVLVAHPTFPDLLLDWFDAHTQPGVGTATCAATVNSTGKPAGLHTWGSLSATAGESLSLVAASTPPGQTGAFLFAAAPGALPFGNGTLCVDPSFLMLPFQTGAANGEVRVSFLLPIDVGLVGLTFYAQYAFFDPDGGPAHINLTDGRALTLSP